MKFGSYLVIVLKTGPLSDSSAYSSLTLAHGTFPGHVVFGSLGQQLLLNIRVASLAVPWRRRLGQQA
jgi:hypothetical protein